MRAAFLKRKLEDATLQQQANQGCGQDLRNFVVELFASASLSATDVVKLCHLITAAGGVGVSDLAVKPEMLPNTVMNTSWVCCRKPIQSLRSRLLLFQSWSAEASHAPRIPSQSSSRL